MTRHKTVRVSCFTFIWVFGISLSSASAQLAQRPAQEYIDRMDRPERVANLNVDEVITKLQLEPGDVVADIGSGSGAFSIPMARAIAPTGTLYAVDIDQAMIDFVANRATSEGLSNVRPVLGEYDDPKLPVQDVDVAFFHRVLHMIENRQAYINAVATYLKPDGRIVIIDRNPEEPLRDRIDVTVASEWMWLRQTDVDTWMAAIGFYPVHRFDDVYENRYFVAYQKPYGR